MVHCCAKWICWILSTDDPNIEPSWAIVENDLMMPTDICYTVGYAIAQPMNELAFIVNMYNYTVHITKFLGIWFSLIIT